MRTNLILVLFAVLILGQVDAQVPFTKAAETRAFKLYQTGETQAWCPVCGMNLKMFYKTNHLLTRGDGGYHQYCSIRCLAADLPNTSATADHLMVVDAKTEKMIPVNKARYVIGGDVQGTMTRVSKIAFRSKRHANRFLKDHNAMEIVDYDKALKLAKKQMEADNAMLLKKQQSMVFPKGARLFNQSNLKLEDIPEVASIASLKAFLKTHPDTAELTKMELQTLALYLWRVALPESQVQAEPETEFNLPKDAKCPVCGMFVHKYPRWVASLQMSEGETSRTLYFDGVKDLMKFYLTPSRWMKVSEPVFGDIRVTDYYSQRRIDGTRAVFVVGSDILGPMGNEFIAFKTRREAETFLKDHTGRRIVLFKEIDATLITELDK